MPYRKRFNKKQDILAFMSYQSTYYEMTHFTMRSLAINLGYAPSTKFNKIIWEMVDEDLLRVQFVDHVKYSAVGKKAFVCLPEHHSENMQFVELS